uniref:Olfactory receptor n=1 Tax=Xenopus tropicalis TaxID=8364 RepID=A0A6I8QML8_XENTR
KNAHFSVFWPKSTEITEILLLGFQNLQNLRILLFISILIIYIISLAGNIVIITLISTLRRLHTPMYTFLGLLSSSEIISTTNIVPNMLVVIAADGSVMPFTACLSQFYIFSALTNTECFLLTMMSYDRYLAICHPLRYNSIMNSKLCLQLIIWSWVLVFFIITTGIILVCQLHFCGFNQIDHFLCDFGPIVALSTSDTSVATMYDFMSSIPTISAPFIFIIGTYVHIFITILKMNSKTGRQKTFSTCSSHLTVVCTYYGTQMIVYMGPTGDNYANMKKFLSLLYVIITPFMNPIIYSLSNKEIRETLKKYIRLM